MSIWKSIKLKLALKMNWINPFMKTYAQKYKELRLKDLKERIKQKGMHNENKSIRQRVHRISR